MHLQEALRARAELETFPAEPALRLGGHPQRAVLLTPEGLCVPDVGPTCPRR